MPKINVVRPFNFNKADGKHLSFSPGINEIDKETSAHPWIADGADGCIAPMEAVKVPDSDGKKGAELAGGATSKAGAG
jgi:hypothetical protein